LNGEDSYDPDGTEITYLWEQIGSPEVTLSASNIVNPTFIAPEVNSTPLILTFSLTVTDEDGATNVDTVNLEVIESSNNRPIARAGFNRSTPVSESSTPTNFLQTAIINLDGTRSSDVEDASIDLSY